jgi:hypothetical protein
MKTKLLLAFGFVAGFIACTEEVDKPTLWGIEYSEPQASKLVAGLIERQEVNTNVTFVVNQAYLKETVNGRFMLSYKFSSNDSLKVIINKKTSDVNYAFPGQEESNELLYATFNQDTLDLKESSVSIQPKTGQNKFTTIIKLKTNDFGDFEGTVNSIPLLRPE